MKAAERLERSQRVNKSVAAVFQKRMQVAKDKFAARLKQGSLAGTPEETRAQLAAVLDPANWQAYGIDAVQRGILFWETLRQRGSNYLEHNAEGLKPVLHFEYQTVLDGRSFERPVNYALLCITPPAGVKVDPKLRPYIIIDPRAGHGPGIGGFKDDSQVGVALRAGHPVYFVIFYREPEPGQTLLDVCRAEQLFVKKVRELHPRSAKPAIIGNCQGGWAAMMLAASDPEDTGPIVINGAPMSYWGGAWTEGEGDNPMRYAGGMMGGSWMASFAADLGAGKFDGAHLVQNFEKLNPANALWDKYYHLYDRADTEPPRFLEFERWWGGYYLMNAEEIEWITRNLFVGNKVWQDQGFDLREIRAPIVLFASMGDNITPPQQAFNWVADVYTSSAEIKARGQVIVGLLHEDVGHLGIFVSGKVAKKEHATIVDVLQSIEGLAPGLYGMEITDKTGSDGKPDYEVEFRELRLEDIAQRLNRFERADEKAFEAVAQVSDLNQKAYERFGRPLVQAMSSEKTAEALRQLHPLRVQNWAVSNANPWLSWLAPAAEAVKADRHALAGEHPLRQAEHVGAEWISASLDYYRALRDAMTEAGFFSVYANIAAPAEEPSAPTEAEVPGQVPAQELQYVLDAVGKGGYVEALARASFLLKKQGQPLPLSRMELRKELVAEYADELPDLSAHEWRRLRGQQEIIARYAPEQAVQTLPQLLQNAAERKRFTTLLKKLISDPRVQDGGASPEQLDMLAQIQSLLRPATARTRVPARAAAAAPAKTVKPSRAKTTRSR
ncbi:DUF3141 domain-containing protein [Variovorax sp. HJSM1_2]|uniref:DUF3141 domain-containing protein n=1 Tax=Variovorax sp. HJSM1_2 TaxID=3366263 RepID=UPI003BC2B192